MTPEYALYFIMVDNGMVINDGTMYSLRKAVEDGNVYFFDDDGEPSGFCTWRFDGKELIVENLCMFSKKGISKLFLLRDFFHQRYPNLLKVRWTNEARGKEISYEFTKDEHDQRPVTVAKDSGR
jgi:hypothetical protein